MNNCKMCGRTNSCRTGDNGMVCIEFVQSQENCKMCSGLGCLECEKEEKIKKLDEECVKLNEQFPYENGLKIYPPYKQNRENDFITINPDGETYNIKAANGVILEVPKANELKDMFDGFIGFKDNPLSNLTSNISVEIPIHLVKPIELLLKEYKSACEKHPKFPSNKFEQIAILSEEVGEYSKECQLNELEGEISKNTLTELAQTGAVVLRIVEQYQDK